MDLYIFIPWACARWFPIIPWQFTSILIGHASWYWVSVRHCTLMSSIHSLLGLPLPICLPQCQTPHSSPTSCHPSYRCVRIIVVSFPRSIAAHSCYVQRVVSKFDISSTCVCGEFFCNISFQMPSTSLNLSSSGSRFHTHIVNGHHACPYNVSVCWCACCPYFLEPGRSSSCTSFT